MRVRIDFVVWIVFVRLITWIQHVEGHFRQFSLFASQFDALLKKFAGIATRVGLAEPLARPTRSALLVAMYALVIFTVTFIVVFNAVFQAIIPFSGTPSVAVRNESANVGP